MGKFYVVRKGRVPGVYDNLDDVMEQVDGYPGAYFQSYATPQAAANAWRGDGREDRSEIGHILAQAGGVGISPNGTRDYLTIPEIDLNGWAVDASCMGNPGVMEYRGVELISGRELFKVGPFPKGTNNLGEFLAIVHAMALMEQRGENHPIYSDSITGISWIRNRKIKTQLKEEAGTEKLFEMLHRGMNWLNTHSFRPKLIKWETKLWGEIPADFGRKA